MKSPQDQRIIQIDVTNACIHRCSNCTRFCGNHKKPFYMNFETFKRAVDSLEGYVGTIGIMGGEPTLNPEFEKMANYLASKKPAKQNDDMLRPQEHFMDAIHDLEMEHTFVHPCLGDVRQTVDGPGLWSAIGENYKKYYETIQDTIQYQALNDHSNSMYHQPALISRKELGISDEEWIPMRDKCWVQNEWSACVTPKGAFFCEIAGALDMLFDGPGGWDIEPGWWERTPEEFGEQLKWCEICGIACDTFMRDANEQVFDVSPLLYEKLKETGSPLVGTDHINVLDIKDGKIPEENKAASKRFSTAMPYTESYSARFNEDKSNLLYKEIVGVIECKDNSNIEKVLANIEKFKICYILADIETKKKIENACTCDCEKIFIDSAEHEIGYAIYQALRNNDYNRYALILSGDIEMKNVYERFKKLVFNPGVMLYSAYDAHLENDYFIAEKGSKACFINGIAKSIKECGWDKILKMNSLEELKSVWQSKKVLNLAPEIVRKAPSVEIEEGKRYAIYGAGRMLKPAIDKINDGKGSVVMVIDGSDEKNGTTICGIEIHLPEYLAEHKTEIDKVLISSGYYYHDMKKRLLEMGFKETDLAWI